MTGRVRLRALSLCLLSSIAGVAAADDYLSMDLEQLLQVNITGVTLRDESLKTVPSVVTVFTREQLDTLGLDYLFELMRLVPGFQVNRVADNPLNYTFSAAGRRTGSRAREVALVVDGRLFVDPRSSGADSAFALFPLANIERVEIIQGPGSAIYGSGAFTGVINIVSRRSGNAVSVMAGSDQRRKADLHVNHAQGDWQFNLFAHAYEDQGQEYRLASGLDTRDPRQELGVDVGLAYRQTRAQLTWFRLRADDFYVLEKVFNDFNHFQPQYRHFMLEQGFNPRANWQTKLSYHYQSDDQDLHALLSPAGALTSVSQPASDDPVLTKVNFFAEAHKLALANDVSLSDEGSVQFGLEWLRAKEVDAKAYTNFNLAQIVNRQFPVAYYGNFDNFTVVETATRRDTASAYAQWLQELGFDTRLTLGVRYDHYENIGDHPSPRLGLVHQLNEQHSIKLLYGEAFRAPSFAETHLTNNPFIRGNPDLDHELVKTWNLVWVGMWQNTSLNLAGFYNRYEAPIISGLDEIGARSYINSNDQQSRGVSLDIKQQLGENWLMRLSLTRFSDLPDSAFAETDRLAAYILNYHKGAWNLNVSFNYQGEREYLRTANEREQMGSYWLANSQLSYELTKGTRIKLTIKNLMDEAYASPPQGAGIIGGIPNRGREWGMGIDWRW
ncbi:TonB-dependent receptor [Cellvibrio sp. UBA7661]|uniref:TonB-dependent receptor plug domain-containing protein n=1 Tax=Cellvibrio sp. UBA7661 TaxID=1946311 RepID=UPI002F35C2C0